MKTYLILGYGIPKKIETNDNYHRYLGIVFNTIFAQLQVSQDASTIIFCGGSTDIYPPYKRNEALEIARLFMQFADRPICHGVTKKWKYLFEKKSLSTLENLVYTKELLETKKIDFSHLTIFCEATRHKRVKRLVKKIFGKANVTAIDFDLTENRYLDHESIEKREIASIKFDDAVLRDPHAMKEYRKAYQQKFALLRSTGSEHLQESLRTWWKIETKK
ncbi:MAG: ElyC/SanA/YdcF family protein [Patescibacteria group bacterium]